MARTSAKSKKSATPPSVRHRKVLRDNIQGLTKPAFMRLLKRAGVKRVSGLVPEELRAISKVFLDRLIQNVMVFTKHVGRKTVKESDLYAALALEHQSLLAGINKTVRQTKSLQGCRGQGVKKRAKEGKGRKFRPGTVALRNIRHEQKKSCLIFTKVGFRRLAAEVAQDFGDDNRFSSGFFPLAQLALESYLIRTAEHAYLISLHSKRPTLYPKDIQLARRIALERS